MTDLKRVSSKDLLAEVDRRKFQLKADEYLEAVGERKGWTSDHPDFDYSRYGYNFDGIAIEFPHLTRYEEEVAKAIVEMGNMVRPGLLKYKECSFSDPYESSHWIEIWTSIPSQKKMDIENYMSDLRRLMPNIKLKFIRKVAEEY